MKIALVELDNSPHDVFFYSQIKFLKSVEGTYVALICNKSLEERLGCYSNIADETHLVDDRLSFFKILKLRKLIINEGFDKVIFNTAHGNKINILLSLYFPKKIEFLGILHYRDKLALSNSQKMISRQIRKYFVLNDHLLYDFSYDPKFRIKSTYLIYYPEFKRIPLDKKENEIWLCVPGVVEFSRRDYVGLVKSIGQKGLNMNIKFILLGNSRHKNGDGEPLLQLLQEFGLQDRFMLWEHFIEVEEFFSYIQESDFIMPLVHANHESSTLYINQTTGAYNLAYGFKKMLLMDESFSQDSDLKANSIFYNIDNLADTINNLQLPSKDSIYKEAKWDFNFQASNYWDLINAD